VRALDVEAAVWLPKQQLTLPSPGAPALPDKA
jgi:hypothetical protein